MRTVADQKSISRAVPPTLFTMADVENSHALLNVDSETLDRLAVELLDQNEQMAKRMRTVFTLRNIGGTRAVTILASGM